MWRTIPYLYCEIFMSLALIVVEIFAFLHGTLLLLILYKILTNYFSIEITLKR